MAFPMPDISARVERLALQARAWAAKLRPHHFAVALGMAVVVVGIVAVRAVALPGSRPALEGERLQIQVVAPREPTVTPGAVMEVGDLVDGFEGVPSPKPGTEFVSYAPWDEEVEVRDRRAPSKPQGKDAVIQAPPQPAPPGRWREGRVGRWFGFDTPERDYRAEREERRARLEAQAERDRDHHDDREVRWYSSDGRSSDGPPARRD